MRAARAAWTRQLGGTTPKRSKYGAVKTAVAGVTFDSKREARRWQELLLLQAAGEIRELVRQPRYDLWAVRRHQTTARTLAERVEVVGRFTPDFRYRTKDGQIVIEDVKSPSTRRETSYRLRKRIFEANYGIEIQET